MGYPRNIDEPNTIAEHNALTAKLNEIQDSYDEPEYPSYF
jgi:hypothetical protein